MTDTRHPGLITPDNAPRLSDLNDDGTITEAGRQAIYSDVQDECVRQHANWRQQSETRGATGDDFFIEQWGEIVAANPAMEGNAWGGVLLDAARQMANQGDSDALRAFLIEVAAQLVFRCEALDELVTKKALRICRSAGCVKTVRARGLCVSCYGKRRSSGSLKSVLPRRTDDLCVRCGDATQMRRGSYCRACASDYERGRRQRNADEINRRKRERYDPSKNFEQRLRYAYNLTRDQYDQMLLAQNGSCAVCHRDAKLHVDHDHRCCPGNTSCGACVRGLLCSNCNNGLGRFKDDPDALERAATYLRGVTLVQDVATRTAVQR